VRNARIVCATIFLAATVAGALWAYTYRVWTTYGYVEYWGQAGYHFHATGRGRESAWWSAPASVVVLFLGVAIALWLLPGQRSLIRRLTDQFAHGNKIILDR
jgi:hypothetical protein